MSSRRRAQVLLAGALVLGAALCLNLRAEVPRGDVRRGAERETRATGARRSAEARPSRADFVRLLASAQQEDRQQASAEHAQHPHPITSEHARLYRDVDLLHAADEAIKAGAFDSARDLLAQHHRELRGMSNVEEEGLLLLADCAQEPSADNLARVQGFYDEHSESSVRRRLRRACLELPGLRH
jgi:hypothetical protein